MRIWRKATSDGIRRALQRSWNFRWGWKDQVGGWLWVGADRETVEDGMGKGTGCQVGFVCDMYITRWETALESMWGGVMDKAGLRSL